MLYNDFAPTIDKEPLYGTYCIRPLLFTRCNSGWKRKLTTSKWFCAIQPSKCHNRIFPFYFIIFSPFVKKKFINLR